MFLCKPCHDESGCTLGEFAHLPSYGSCECCRKTGTTLDCHGYDFRGSKHSHEPEKIYYKPRKRRLMFVDDDLQISAENHHTGESVTGPAAKVLQDYVSAWCCEEENVWVTIRQGDFVTEAVSVEAPSDIPGPVVQLWEHIQNCAEPFCRNLREGIHQ